MCKHIFLCSVCNGAASAVCMFDLVGVKVDGFPVRERKNERERWILQANTYSYESTQDVILTLSRSSQH